MSRFTSTPRTMLPSTDSTLVLVLTCDERAMMPAIVHHAPKTSVQCRPSSHRSTSLPPQHTTSPCQPMATSVRSAHMIHSARVCLHPLAQLVTVEDSRLEARTQTNVREVSRLLVHRRIQARLAAHLTCTKVFHPMVCMRVSSTRTVIHGQGSSVNKSLPQRLQRPAREGERERPVSCALSPVVVALLPDTST